MRFDVFGRVMHVVREGEHWSVYYHGTDGTRRRVPGATIPPWVDEDGVGRFLADLYHESASPERPDVVRLPDVSAHGPTAQAGGEISMPGRSAAAGTAQPRLYGDLADWWPLLSAPEDYAEEAAFYLATMVDACAREPRTLLELGCGGGSNASHMKPRFEAVTLTDLSPGMIEVSRRLNPDCQHVVGDMRTLRLGRRFDCVFVHDAVTYMTTEPDLRAAIETAFVHCEPGGAALFAPDALGETFREATSRGGHDGEGRALRYLEWSWDPDPTDTTVLMELVYVLRGPDGSVEVVHDRHVEGLFPRATWLRLLSEVGFEAEARPFVHSDIHPGSMEVFVARKPGAPGGTVREGRA